MSMKTKDARIQSAGTQEKNQQVAGERLEPEQRQARHGHKVCCGSRIINNCRNEAGMSMKTKDQCRDPPSKAGMSMKTQVLIRNNRNVFDNKALASR